MVTSIHILDTIFKLGLQPVFEPGLESEPGLDLELVLGLGAGLGRKLELGPYPKLERSSGPSPG